MQNLPYSSPQTKALAHKISWNARPPENGLSAWLLGILLIPLGIYFFAAGPLEETPYLGGLFHFLKTRIVALREGLAPELIDLNGRIRSMAVNHNEGLQDVAAVLGQTPQQKPAYLSIPVSKLRSEGPQFAKDTGLDLLEAGHYALPGFTKDDFLTDKYNRVPEVFKIPNSLKKRVGFWLDIYSLYSSSESVIHHVEFPWIVFKVINTARILEGPENRWIKFHRAESAVKNAMRRVRQDLYALSLKKDFSRVTPEQKYYLDLLEQIPGKRKAVLASAARHIRSQLGQKEFYKNGLTSGSRYISRMEEIFAQYDLPIELTRLPLVESSFNESAVSKVGASGIWQFMPGIGRRYLKVYGVIDERNSPLKATDAAARLLLQNFRITKTWPFALTAYNHGPGGVLKAAHQLKTKDLSVIIERFNSERFGFASSNFYCSFLAALHAERYQEEIFGQIPKYPFHRSDSIRLAKEFKTQMLVGIAGITIEELKLFNPDLKSRAITQNTWLPAGLQLFLPQGRKARLELYQMEVRASSKRTGVRRRASAPSLAPQRSARL